MSTIKSLDNNYYSKEYDNIEKYLLRIIKRFFDLEELNNLESINAVITEAINRYKAGLTYKPNNVLTLNNKYGIVNIDLIDLGGELKFAKADAFNKDFGTEADTICNGADPRLSDDRIPTEHHHKMEDVIGLIEALENLNRDLSRYKYHYHINKKTVLDKLRYTNPGPLDLKRLEEIGIIVEDLIADINMKLAILVSLIPKDEVYIDVKLQEFYGLLQELYNYYLTRKVEVTEQIKNTIITKLTNYYNRLGLDDYIDNPKSFITKIKRGLNLVYSQEVDLESLLEYKIHDAESEDDTSMKVMYDNSDVYWIQENTLHRTQTDTDKHLRWVYDDNQKGFICQQNTNFFEFFLSDFQCQKYDFTVKLTSDDSDNDLISVIIATVGDVNQPEGNKIYVDAPGLAPFRTISLNVNRGRESHIAGEPYICLSYGYGFSETYDYKVLAIDETMTVSMANGAWNGEYILIRVIRNKSHFTIYRSNFNSDTLIPTPIFNFDLFNFPFLNEIFNDECYYKNELIKSQYGLGAHSQRHSKFLDFSFEGTENPDLVDKSEQVPLSPQSNSIVDNEIIASSISDFSLTNMVIKSYLLYNENNKKIKRQLPWVTEDFVLYPDVVDKTKLKMNIRKTRETDYEMPNNIIRAKVLFEFFSEIS